MTQIYLTMPQPGETITEGKIIRWIAKEGDLIKVGDIVSELETEKALFEFESPFEGRLTTLIHHEGENVPVGEPIAVVEVEDSKAATYLMMGMGKKGPEVDQKKSEPEAPALKTHTSSSHAHSPYVRKMMAEHHISDEQVETFLKQNNKERLTKEDVTVILSPLSGAKDLEILRTASRAQNDNYTDTPVAPIRARIAENMLKSVTTIPHAHTNVTIDMTKLVEKRKQTKQNYLILLWPYLKEAILKHPLINSTYVNDPKNPFIRLYKNIHLGVSVDTIAGLFIPVVKNAQDMDEKDLEKKWATLLTKTNDNKLGVDELTGATFTFNNFGYFGTNIGMQIILPPQAATLGMGRIEKRPWVVDDKIEIKSVSEWMLAFDHRVMDGRDAARFMEALKKLIEG